MRHGSLYTGIGGWLYASMWMGWNNIFTVEHDDRCNKLIKQQFPEVDRYGKIEEFEATRYAGGIDVLTTSDPCQPASTAGKRKGSNDSRFLWPETIRIVRAIKSPLVIYENVPGILSLEDGKTFERICTDLEGESYTVEPIVFPACSLGAWHRRDRVFIIAYNDDFLYQRGLGNRGNQKASGRSKRGNKSKRKAPNGKRVRVEPGTRGEVITDTNSKGLQVARQARKQELQEETRTRMDNRPELSNWWKVEPGVVRVVHGIPDRKHRIEELGNAIIPQIAYEIFKAIDGIT